MTRDLGLSGRERAEREVEEDEAKDGAMKWEWYDRGSRGASNTEGLH